MTWGSLVWKNLMRRRARTGLTALGVGLGVGLIIALLAITAGVHRTADDLIHVGRADFGLFQGDVNDFTRSNLPQGLAASVAKDAAIAQVAKIKLLVNGGTLVFGLDPSEFAYRRLVVVSGRRGPVMAGDHSGKHAGQVVAVTEPGQAVKVDTSSRLIISTGWIVSILALIVGGIGVTNTMAMSVFERVREIGILRALGWSRRRVAALIVSEALGIGVIALVVGCAFGILAAELFVSHSALSSLITPTFTASTFAWGLGFALGVGLLGAIYPTLRAVRLSPVAALRHE